MAAKVVLGLGLWVFGVSPAWAWFCNAEPCETSYECIETNEDCWFFKGKWDPAEGNHEACVYDSLIPKMNCAYEVDAGTATGCKDIDGEVTCSIPGTCNNGQCLACVDNAQYRIRS